MSAKSDHDKKGMDIIDILPEVYRSDVNKTVADAAFNKFLTKDDTVHVAGYIGEGNPNALVKRQLPEPTAHRQAFQLAPIVHTTVGTEEYALTQTGFLQQLEMMGVNTDDIANWASTERFNWVPPINLDMFVNYADYFWKSDSTNPPQYFTIENQCNKALSKLRSYQSILTRRGREMEIVSVDFALNAFVIADKHDDLFVKDFGFVTKGTTNTNLSNKTWFTTESTYDSSNNTTTIKVAPFLALQLPVDDLNNQPAMPTAIFDGQWLYKYSTNPSIQLNQLYAWNGTAWVLSPSAVVANISLTDQEAVYVSEVNCACNNDIGGWDTGQWDDSQEGTVMWNEELLSHINHSTEAEWIAANGTPQLTDLWYDLTTDTLKQRAPSGWQIVRSQFSNILAETTGQTRWDASVGCVPQRHNQWTMQNRWVHKSELTSFVGYKRAQVPILEYSSTIELNEWTEVVRQWKYRDQHGQTFQSTPAVPHRLELEPIKSYVATNMNGVWYVYLGSASNAANLDIDYTSTFVPGFRFRIVDRFGHSVVYTVASSIFKQCTAADPQYTPTDRFCTIVELVETDFTSVELAGTAYEPATDLDGVMTPPYTRIEPVRTSLGDPWRGYHQHWLLDVGATIFKPSPAQPVNPFSTDQLSTNVNQYAITSGMMYVASTYQEFTPNTGGVVDVPLDSRFQYSMTTPRYYALLGGSGSGIRVYVNGVRQYNTYAEISAPTVSFTDYTVVSGASLLNNVTRTPVPSISGVRFRQPLAETDVVRIEIGPASFADIGMYAVPVRTVEDDDAFASATALSQQPQLLNLSQFQRNEQAKTAINQYPAFNMYDVITGETTGTSPLFSYAEDSSYPVDPSTHHRIVKSADGREFKFEQHLVEASTGVMHAYREIVGTEPKYWYSPYHQQLKQWDGTTWTSSFLTSTDAGWIAVTPVVSATEPTDLLNRHASIWVNPLTQQCMQRDAINGSWNPLTVTIAAADPTLRTIWKTSAAQPSYVPAFVDQDGNTTTGNGDWEVLSQWRNNPEHDNHREIMYSQLITHMSSIVNQQPQVPGLSNRGIFTLRQADYDFSVGGTIKEHNGAFDALISAVNLNDVTPVGVIEFAQAQYVAGLTTIRDMFTRSLVDALIELSGYPVRTIQTSLSDRIIAEYASNDFFTRLYSDSTSYLPEYVVGMPNWVATAPIMGLHAPIEPHMVSEPGSSVVVHHDGHRTTVAFTAAEHDQICRTLVKTYNAAIPGSAVISSTQPTTAILPVYWYKTGAPRALYKLTSSSYELVDFTTLLASVYLDIEQRLYQASTIRHISQFDYTSIEAAPEYVSRMYARFYEYVNKRQIRAPLVNTTYNIKDAFTWNYGSSIVETPPTSKSPAPRSCWQALYTHWYGTPYPHLEPWALQGFSAKPQWWDNEYRDTTGTRRWRYDVATLTGMWENIRTGIVPAGYAYPNGTISTGVPTDDGVSLPTYEYFSVNTTDTTIAGGYGPDALLPPYYDSSALSATHPTVRSLFTTLSTQVIAPNADFTLGEYGPTEWEWTVSSEHVYDRAIVSFLIQPARFLRRSLGADYVIVDQLEVDVLTKKVYNHRDALFHGDIHGTSNVYQSRGLNQWYVNYNRFNGYDTNVNFREMWSSWTPRQAYQTAGIMDTSTLQIFNKHFDVTDRDYRVMLANIGVIGDVWADAFNISVMNIPSAIIQYNNQSQWKFALTAQSPVARSIEYYGPQQYPFIVDPDTDTLTAFAFDIEDVTASVKVFEVRGNQTAYFLPATSLTVSGSSTNDGTYTVSSSAYDTINGTTRITTVEPIPTSIRDGRIDIPEYAHGWATGTTVMLDASGPLPLPLEGSTAYHTIRISPRQIKLARTASDAAANIAVDITSAPNHGELRVGHIKSTFYVFGGSANNNDLWIHYQPNTNDVRVLQTPDIINGMQTLINFIDGYETIQRERGVLYEFNNDFIEYDSETGRPVSWQLELERFIDWAYTLRRSRLQLVDRHPFVVSSTTESALRFTDSAPQWVSGTKVALTTTGNLPSTLFADTPYYIIRTDDPQVFKLSTSSRISDGAEPVEIADTGSGLMSISLYSREQSYPVFELNASRNNLWISTPYGMVSDVIRGPYTDIRSTQAIYDQYGRFIDNTKLTIFRGDKVSRISVRPELRNDVEWYPANLHDPNNYIHIGGGRFFIEGYEHIILFNNYTVGNDLVYDPFLGLYTKRFDLDYFEGAEYTMRPNLGGFYLLKDQFIRNIEGSAQDARAFYDAYTLNEGTPIAKRARNLLGYRADDGSMSYLDLLNINAKSKFLYYRGMIQTKGSVDAIKAFINNRKFIDAKVDEFWAYKVADIGDSRPKIYPRIKLFTVDSLKPDLRLKFAGNTQEAVLSTDERRRGFELVSFGDGTRWDNFPQQRAELQSPLFLNANITSMLQLYITRGIGPGTDPVSGQATIDVWIHIDDTDPSSPIVMQRVWDDGQWVLDDVLTVRLEGSPLTAITDPEDPTDPEEPPVEELIRTYPNLYVLTPTPHDAIRVLRRRLTTPTNLTTYTTEVVGDVDVNDRVARVNSEVIKLSIIHDQYAFSGIVSTIDDEHGFALDLTTTPDLDIIQTFRTGDTIEYAGAIYTVRGALASPAYVFVDRIPTPGDIMTTGTFFHTSGSCVYTIFTVGASSARNNPARLLDTKSHVKLADVPMWHPAIGIHAPVPAYNIDLWSASDPARFTNSIIETRTSSNPWLAPEVNTTWLDTTTVGYIPYYDDKIFPSISDRINRWGTAAPWSTPRVYQWVGTTIRPEDWDSIAASHATDDTIPSSQKITGTPKKTTFRRTRPIDVVTVTDTVIGLLKVATPSQSYENGTAVYVSPVNDDATLPSSLVTGTIYTITMLNDTTGEFSLLNADGTLVDLTDAPVAMNITQPFTESWQPVLFKHERTHSAIASYGTVITLTATDWVAGDIVDVYINGTYLTTTTVVDVSGHRAVDLIAAGYRSSSTDLIDIVRPVPTLTADQLAFDPDTNDDGVTPEQWTELVEYSTINRTEDGTTVPYFYYWVEGITVPRKPGNDILSIAEVARQLNGSTSPYLIVQDPQDVDWLRGYDIPPYDTTGYDAGMYRAFNSHQQHMPSVMYRKAILKNVVQRAVDDDRFIVEFTCDATLRDTIASEFGHINLKNKHEQWMMFRRDQVSAVPRAMWNKACEALIGYRYDNLGFRLPTLDREYYDQIHGTDVRYGMGPNQIFAEPRYARKTLVDYLQHPDRDFRPVDIDHFFEMFPCDQPSFWDTPQDVKDMCDYIYTSFSSEHVNGIWFDILLDALATKTKYAGIMKTSWLAIHGIRLLDVGGFFDE